ncbi:hypothetical protein MHM98_11430 [Psychrobium sp. MM17-31]|uniref:hypothetical protein n=1 Tax=Psychrobium sp. MM17-31 TaxID=2917758 RepID=UPI001EF4B2AD|nr:hypothetical protein [Psychrobium sp. MM17-31]MCG7531948.1 hypothetical protein [Psychrobium sp. MM17-31]
MTEKKAVFSADRLNLIIALCAIFISLASFYATYLQASAAEKQVKAMTLPLMVFEHGNYNSNTKTKVINFSMGNSGSGAAIIHNTSLMYQDNRYNNIGDFLNACCSSEYKQYREFFAKDKKLTLEDGGFVTKEINGVVLPAQSDRNFFTLFEHPNSQALWKKINNERWKLDVEFCYCTLLDDCFVSTGNGIATSVKSCPVK